MRNSFRIGLGLVFLTLLSRLIPHPSNFSPVMGLAIFAGAYFSKRWVGVVLTLVGLALSDIWLGWHETMPYVYGSFLALSFIGDSQLNSVKFTWGRLGIWSSLSAVLFFVATNLGVWLSAGLYSRDLAGLLECFTLALVFFPATLASAWVYSFSLFGIWQFALSPQEARS
jgi:hypothetical protein